jgi:cardiolipin synthase
VRIDDLYDVGAQDGPELVSDRIVTVPNALSALRLLAMPLVWIDIVGDRPVRALLVLFVLVSTDWIDGYVARRFNQITKLGKVLDPISDRVLVTVVVLALVSADIVAWWAIAGILVRDVLVAAVGLALLSKGAGTPAVTRLGKTATFALMSALPALLLAEALGDGARDVVRVIAFAMLATGTVAYWGAAAQYARVVRTTGDVLDG